MVTKICALTFSISHFHDIVLCDVSPLDFTYVFIGIPYQELHHSIYHARNHQYHLQKHGHTYFLTSSSLKSHTLLFVQPGFFQISFNKSLSLYLVRPLKPENPSHALPLDMDSLFTSFAYVFTDPTKLPPICSIENSIDHILGATFPNSPSYFLPPHEAVEVEHHLEQLINTNHIQIISSLCAFVFFIIPKKDPKE
jgi:hypothetical protein